jgi:hypothetical protein
LSFLHDFLLVQFLISRKTVRSPQLIFPDGPQLRVETILRRLEALLPS